MNGTDLFTKMTELDNDLIEEAMNPAPKKRNFNLLSYQALASSLALVLLGSIAVKFLYFENSNKQVTPTMTAVPTAIVEDTQGVLIPKIEFPSRNQAATADMVSLVTYKGRVYTGSLRYRGDETKAIEHLIGDHLGSSQCIIDEYSSKELYSVDFASTTPCGELYTVKGYDPSFRLCSVETINENGTDITLITFFDNENGIRLKTGYDLFETRLHLISNWSSVTYRTATDLQTEREHNRSLRTVTDKQITSFLTALSSSEFHNLGNKLDSMKPIGELQFTLKDHTTVTLYLYEGGYVDYGNLFGYCVKIPDKIFAPLYKVCNPSR